MMDFCEEAMDYGLHSDDLSSSKDDTTDMTVFMPNYPKDAIRQMQMMRSNQLLTDVILEVDQELYHCHKIVLSAASPYFQAMFTGGLRECEMNRVKLQGVCPAAMSRIISFMYSGQVRVTEVDVCQLLTAATMFQVANIIEACCNFLERQLDSSNAIGIAEFAEQQGCDALKQKANQYIERHFTKVCQEEEFLQLSDDLLVKLIRRDRLNVQGEKDVYNAVMAWVRYDDRRISKFESILSSVRCQYLAPNFIKQQMQTCDVFNRVPSCREYLRKICHEITQHRKPAVKERTPNTTRMIFVAGGYFKHSLDILEAFNVDDKTWVSMQSLRVPRSGLGGAFLQGTFYAVGGRSNTAASSYDSDWVDRYHPIRETWRPCAPMSVPRNRVGVAVMDELLYALGGSAGSDFHDTVEYYDPQEDRWHIVKSMNYKRVSVGVAVVNRLLYAIGGYDGSVRLNSAECYHPENDEWTIINPMKCARSGAGVAAIGQYIYVVGGYNESRQLSSVERYDTESGTWEFMAPLRVARSALSLTALDGKLWAMGGFDGANFLTTVEVYDPATNVWTDGVPLTSGRSGHAAAVIYTPSNITGTDFNDTLIERGGNPSAGRDSDNGKSHDSSRNHHTGIFNSGGFFGSGGPCGSSSSARDEIDAMQHENGENLVNQVKQEASPARRKALRQEIVRQRFKQNLSARQNEHHFELPYNIDIDLLDFRNRIYYCRRCEGNNCPSEPATTATIIQKGGGGKHTCPGAILKRAVLKFLTNFTSSDHKRSSSCNNNRPCKRL
ncbi:kelch-like ECH-associated protein 1B isoform X2 [Culicoides brevitarsis]